MQQYSKHTAVILVILFILYIPGASVVHAGVVGEFLAAAIITPIVGILDVIGIPEVGCAVNESSMWYNCGGYGSPLIIGGNDTIQGDIPANSIIIRETASNETLVLKVADNLSGNSFVSGVTVKLIKNQRTINCTVDFVSSELLNNIVCDFGSIDHAKLVDYVNASPWDIRITNPDSGTADLSNALSLVSIAEPPQNPSVSAINHGFNLSWEVPDFTGGLPLLYKVYKGTDPDNLNIPVTVGANEFGDNRIKDTSETLYYKIATVNVAGESAGITVNTAGMTVQNIVTNITLNGSGFLPESQASTTVWLIKDADYRQCTNFRYKDSHTLINGRCDITGAATGTWDVKIKVGDQIAILPDGFSVTYPLPVSPTVGISKTDLSDKIFQVDWVQGDNLYTGAIAKIAVDALRQSCFNLANFDYDTNQFIGPAAPFEYKCDIATTTMDATNGDMSKVKLVIANDENSVEVSPSGLPSFTCSSSVWSPLPSEVCEGDSFTQRNVCGTSRSATGTWSRTWVPDPSTVCSGTAFQQTSCTGTRITQGTKYCCTPATQYETCTAQGRECDSYSDGCGGSYDCGTCSILKHCSGGKCVF